MASRKLLGYQQITSLAAATALTIPAGTSAIEVVAITQACRWRADGTNPTTSVGMPIFANSPKLFEIEQFSALRFIETAGSANLEVTYYGT